MENQISYLLERALDKQRQLHSAFLQKEADVNPLIIVQIPNKNEVMQDEIERWFEARGIFRSDLLRQTDAHIKFISAEPLLSSLDGLNLEGIDWLIVGGESGPGCRPMKKEWVLDLKNLCETTDTAFFFKQWGGTNKKKTGSLLDGKMYKDYPSK